MGKFSAYKLPLMSLTKGEHKFEYVLEKKFFEDMEATDIFGADVKAQLTVSVHDEMYQLHFEFNGEVIVLCDRCLDELPLPIDTTYDITVKYGDRYCDESDEVLEIPSTDSYLNVAYMMFDSVMLAIPIKHVHPLGKCNRKMSALLHKHGATAKDADEEEQELLDEMDADVDTTDDTPTDPRWDALKNLN